MANAATSENNNSVGGKKLTELKVVELRCELEKRGLDKTGVKAVLLERLVKALEGEGKVPDDYLFVESELKSKKSLGRLSRSATEEKEMKDEEDDETEDEDGSLITTDEYCQQNDSINMNSNLEVENSDKVMDVDESTDVDEPTVAGDDVPADEVPAVAGDDEPTVNNVDEPTLNNVDEPMVDNVEPTVDNADKELAVDIVDEVENDVQDMITNETEAPPTEKQIMPEADADKITSQVETNDTSSDPAALPPQSSSSSSTEVEDANTKEKEEKDEEKEKQQNGAEEDKSTTAAGTEEDDHSAAPASTNDVENENSGAVIIDLLMPPTPTSVPCMAPLTLTDTIEMDTSTAQQNEENESLIVHVDDTQNDLDADLLTSQANGLKLKQAAKEKAIGKSEGKISDVGDGNSGASSSNPPEVGGGSVGGGVKVEEVGGGDKGGNAEVKTEKKADEKKDDKDGKLKSSPSVSKLKVIKNLKGGTQNSRNLWISGLSTTTQATDLKGHFSKYGKVVGAKVVTNTRSPGAKCFGFLTMSSAEEASKCIEHLNQTELHGKMISVERAKNEPGTQAAKKTETKPGDKKADKPEVKKDGGGQNSRNLWISGLSSNTRATDLKGLFSKYGKVVGAKVVTNARSPGARCYGFLTMSSSEEASKCIQHLNQTELHGKMISVERAKNEPGTQAAKKPETKPGEKKLDKPEAKKDEKKEGEKKEGGKKEEKKEIKKDDKDKKPVNKRDDKLHRSSSSHRKITDKSRVVVMDKSKGEPVISVKRGAKDSADKSKTTPPSKEKISTTPKSKSKEPSESGKDKAKKDVLSFDQIRISRPSNDKKQLYEYFKAERERERLRQSERRLREEERRRIRELDRARLIQRDVQRRQKEEALRLERVRERLRMEREKLEREKMERERIKLEREILERERFREEQRRAELLRIEEQQRRALKRSYERSNTHEESGFWNEAKRPSLSTPSTRFDHSFSNDSRYNEFDNRDYERRVERYERREARSVDAAATRFEDRKERDLARRDIGPVRDIRDRDERRPDERSRPDDRFERREVGPSRDRSNDRSHDTDRRDLGQDRGRDSDRRSLSAHDRLGRVRNSPAVPPDQRATWGSGIERKVDNWSHTHSNLDNGGVTRQNDRWMSNNIAPSHDRGTTSGGGSNTGSGGFGGGSGGPGASGMVQNMGPGNMYVSPQSQPATMMVGGGAGGNMGSRMQEPRFDAYKHMRRY